MKTFHSIEEMQPYYNENTNTYEFVENGSIMDVEFAFNLNVESHINAMDITAKNINAGNINVGNINAWNIIAMNINAGDINAGNIDAWNITAGDINADDINADDINAGDITAWGITAKDIDAWNINADDINAKDISARDIEYYAVCFAYNNITCSSIKGRRDNAKHFVLDGEITIKKEEKKPVTLEPTEEQLAKIKSILEEEK